MSECKKGEIKTCRHTDRQAHIVVQPEVIQTLESGVAVSPTQVSLFSQAAAANVWNQAGVGDAGGGVFSINEICYLYTHFACRGIIFYINEK